METNMLRKDFDYLIQCTEKLPLSEQTFKRYKDIYEEIFLHCIENQLTLFTYQNAANYCSVKCPTSKAYVVKQTRKIAYTIARYFEDGRFIWKPINNSQYPVCRAYEQLLEKFRQELLGKLSPGTVRVGTGIARQFLYFLEQSGTMDAARISNENVLDFIRQESTNHKSSMSQFLRTMRKFVCFLRSECLVDLNADRFLNNAGRSRQKGLPCFTEDELQRIFQEIDRTTDKGRRDYAVFLLSLRTGLRASLELPLPVDAGNAIADYILHSRYKTDNPYIFLRHRGAPCAKPIEPTSFNSYLRRYMKAAGIECAGWDGKSFHALRRTAGTNMVISGTPVSTVAQVLGHNSIESSKRYISLDTERLRECSLELGDMATRKEGLV